MSQVDHKQLATDIVAELKAGNAFRGCPLNREQQATVAELANTTKKAKRWSGVLVTALLIMFAKDIYGLLATAWTAVTR